MHANKSGKSVVNGRRADGSVRIGNRKISDKTPKKGRATSKTTPNGNKVPKKARNKGRRVAFVIVFWAIIILTAFIYVSYKLTVKPPEITPDEYLPTPSAHIGDDESENNNSTPKPDNTTKPDNSKPRLERKKDFYTFLIIGTDKVGANTDVLMVASFDAANKQAHVINIPRDTIVNVSRKVKKINAAYANGGIDNLKEEISTLIGFKPDFYMLVDLKGFVNLVDAVGGVEFYVPIDMDYDDPSQNLSIHYKKGLQPLDGKSALEVVRFRHNNDGSGYPREDLDRIQTTQKLLAAIAKKMVNLKTLLKINELVDIAVDNLTTDLQTGEMLWFAKEALGIDTETGLHFYTFAEQSCMYKGLSYVYAEEEEALALINSSINPYTTDITDLDLIKPN